MQICRIVYRKFLLYYLLINYHLALNSFCNIIFSERVFRVAFSASISSNVLSSTVSVAMTHEQIQAAFSAVATTTVIDYSSFVLDIDGTTLLRRADLGFIVFSETIVTAAYTDIAFVITQQWNLQFSR